MFTRTAIQRCEMLLADCVRTSAIQSFNLFAIRSLQRTEDSDVTGLELMGSVRRYAAKDDVVLETIFQDLERLVRPEAVTNENPWFLVRPRFGWGSNTSFSQSKLILESV